jgi:ATP-binding cassette subfamily A (ABC1) protein 3
LGAEVKKLSEINTEITVQIPSSYASKFKKFFLDFDENMTRLDIQAYGISITTLEDVFMKVGHMQKPEEVLEG